MPERQPLTPLARELLAGPHFAVVGTLRADGSIQQTVVWAQEREGEIVFSSLRTRAKLRNLERNADISVLVIDRANGYRYTAIRGTARIEHEGAHALVDELSRAYDNRPWPEEPPLQPRSTVVVTPTAVADYH